MGTFIRVMPMIRPPLLQRIVVPTDFSPGAKRALERAARLPIAARGKIHLVHVVARSDRHDGGSLARAADALTKLARGIGRSDTTAGGKGLRIETSVLSGEPYVEIIRHARRVNADLVVLGRVGEGRSIRKVLGTTAARVVRMSDTPVLLVGRPARASYRRALVALALDSSSRRLVDLLHSILGKGTARVSFVHAYRVPFTGFIAPGTEGAPTLHHQQCKEQAAAEFARQLRDLGRAGREQRAVLRWGDARSVILDEATRSRAELIALGTHGRSGIAHALVGSVAEWVITFAKCDVLLARPVRFTFEAP
ncbi:MAG: universal stress protein [Acidobacteria bacterium]|nr:MAG: universal stress protein [Acidobacteriota bacterium]